jgi:SecD/SecF fusion protein
LNRRPYLLLVALIVAALVGVGLLAVPASPLHKKVTLGLDLQGGLEVTLKAIPPEGRKLQKSDIDRSLEIIRNRVDKLGTSEPVITKQGQDQISVELPGVTNTETARSIIGKTAKLELYDLQTAATGPSVTPTTFQINASDSIFKLLSAARTKSLIQQNGEGKPFYLFDRKTQKLLAGPQRTREGLLKKYDGKVPKGAVVLGLPNKTSIVTCGGESAVFCPGVGSPTPGKLAYYLFRHEPDGKDTKSQFPQMTGEDLKLSGTRQDFDTTNGQPIVLMQFTNKGEDKFHDITRAEAQRGRQLYNIYGQGQDPRNFFQSFAIVLDGELITAPVIDFNENPGGIGGGNGAQITGIDSVREAKNIALVLQTGALPVEFRTLSETQISATLGADSLKEAERAALFGLIVVAIFLLIFYRFLGVVAVIGLGIYAALLYAAILIFNVTLTLPGFAGLVLTLGVAADANIVIFERIKEEARAGKSVRAAIAAGYSKGFHTIVDANVVTAITAMVLFAVATAGVKGFALMLLIGTAISMITAIAATRAILGLLAGFSWFDNPKFMGATGQVIPNWVQKDFIGRRRTWFAIAGSVVLISLAAIGIRGLNLGIDFEGGTEIAFSTPKPVAISAVRDEAAKIGQANAYVQGTGAQTGDESFRGFQIRTETLTPGESATLRGALRDDLGVTKLETTTVSASFGKQIARSAILAIIVSLLLIVLYITIRFQWTFAAPVIVALAHDIIITVGIYALLGREVTTSTVAAVLTVLGYSIYDTIIIFDRIRENIPLMRRASFKTIANVSLWETIRRSLATTFITLLPILSLLLFGGDTLKDFAFALLIGIGSGAYSSIFIAAPLLSWFKEREPEYARRRDDVVDAASVSGVLREAEAAAAAEDEAEPEPELVPAAPGVPAGGGDGGSSSSAAKRERRRQRRSSRPHGRAR